MHMALRSKNNKCRFRTNKYDQLATMDTAFISLGNVVCVTFELSEKIEQGTPTAGEEQSI